METQADAQAPAQAQTPVHPIHEETATLNALTKWVSESSDNDPHSGTDLEAPPKEAPQEEVKAEEKPAEATQEEVIEFDEETPFFDLEYNGKKEKLSAKQLREGYLAKADYHRNIQKVKAEEAALAERVKAETFKAQQEYVQRLETHKQAVTKLAGVKSMQEIEQLSREDPAAAQQEFLRLISVNQTMQSIEAEQRQAAEDLKNQQQAAMQAAIQKSREILEGDIKGFAEVYPKVLETISKEYGLDPKDVAQVYDPRVIKVFHDAHLYRQLQQAKPEVSKRVVAVPKVVKPGSVEKPQPAKEQAERSFERLKKTGRMDDAVAAYLSRQKK
jgi:phage FluMu protein gp41